MTNRKSIYLALSLAALLTVVAYMAGWFNTRIAPGDNPPSVSLERESTYRVSASTERRQESVPGTIEAKETTQVSARILARLRAVEVRAGDTVTAGQVLARLEQDDVVSRLRQAQDTARAVGTRLEEATLNLSRAESVRAQGLIAQAELDRAKAQVDTLEAERSAADQRVAEAEAALSWTIVKAPIDGRIVERFAEPGDVVSPGQAIVSLYNPNTLRVAAWVRESVAVTLGPGQVLPLRIPSLGLAFDATIEEVVPAANPGSRSFLVRLVLPAQDKLMPGMYAEVDVPAPSASVIAIPARYIRSLGQLDIVWVASEEQGIERRFVRTGQRDNAMVEIIAGLSQGEALVTPP